MRQIRIGYAVSREFSWEQVSEALSAQVKGWEVIFLPLQSPQQISEFQALILDELNIQMFSLPLHENNSPPIILLTDGDSLRELRTWIDAGVWQVVPCDDTHYLTQMLFRLLAYVTTQADIFPTGIWTEASSQRINNLRGGKIADTPENGESLYQINPTNRSDDHPSLIQSLLFDLLTSTPDLVAMVDFKGRFIYLNPAGRRLLKIGLDEEISGLFVFDFHTPLAARLLREDIFAKVLEEGVWYGENQFLCRDGEEIAVSQVVVAQPIDNQEGYLFSTIARDIRQEKNARQKLVESEERFRAIFEDSQVGIIISDVEGRALQANQAAQQILGYSIEELRKMRFEEVTHPDDLERHLQYVQEAKAGDRDKFTIEKRYLRKDGEIVWCRLNASLIRSADQTPLFAISMIEDITSRVVYEDILKQTRDQLQRLLDVSPVVIFSAEVAPPHFPRYISKNVAAVMGYQDEQYFQNKYFWVDHIHPEDRERVFATIARLPEERTVRFEYRFLHGDGTYHWFLETSTLHYDEHGTPDEILGSYLDITDRKVSEEKIQKSERMYRTLTEAAHDLIFVIDLEDRVLFVNSYSLQALGKTLEEVIMQPRSNLFPEPISSNQRNILQQVIQSKVARYQEDMVIFPFGEVWLGTNLVPLLDDQGNVESILGIARDITERKLVEGDLLQSLEKEKEIGELRSQIINKTSHEFRTPLSTILASAEMLEAYGKKWSYEKQVEHLRRIQNAVKSMNAMLDRTITYGRAQMSRLENHPELVDLVESCNEVLEDQRILEKTGHEILFTADQEYVQAVLDINLLRESLGNLVANALKYSPVDKPVRVSLHVNNNLAEITIHDDGIGIPPEDRPYLFEPFFRAKNTQNFPGYGLGLAIAKEAARTFGGDIQYIESDEGGTTFLLTVPVWTPIITSLEGEEPYYG